MASDTTAKPGQAGGKDNHQQDYNSVKSALLNHEHIFYSPPASPHKHVLPQSQAQPQQQQHSEQGALQNLPTIASLSVHPVIESMLHLLNCDLPSSHFLCRHAEVEPKFEMMYVHGILHRIEGDIDNTRAWYGDVKDSDVFQNTWSDEARSDAPEIAGEGWERFLDRLERYRDRTRSRAGKGGWEGDEDKLNTGDVKDWTAEERLLRDTSLWEMRKVLSYLEKNFGVGVLEDGREAFMGKVEKGAEYAKVAQEMVTGGEGWRTF